VILRDALRQSIERLDRHGISSPRLAAEVLLAHCLSVDRAYLYTHDEQELNESQLQCLEDAIWERASGVPVQYIVGRQEFFGRYFRVNPSVLIPRPETEFLIERVLEFQPAAGSRIIDVGTGSGCIGITLALELPLTQVILADVSMEAVQTARSNAINLGAKNASATCMDLLEAATGPLDFIVSNPPYVSLTEASHLQREVREHEPHVALFAGDDGLAAYRRLIPQARRLLRQGGYIAMEIGFSLEQGVLELFDESWEKLPTRADLQGIPRIVSARLCYKPPEDP
jgi:release factor glutamine methyltransferase